MARRKKSGSNIPLSIFIGLVIGGAIAYQLPRQFGIYYPSQANPPFGVDRDEAY